MPIEACLVARGSVILAEFSPPSTNFSVIASKLVQQIPASPDSKKSYSYDTYNFHYLVERGITYLCMTDQQMGYRVPYAFLFDLASRFRGTYAERIQTAGAMAMNDSFSRVIKERMDFFSNDKQADKINKVKADLDETKNVMFQNIDKVLQRGEQIETLVDKTDELNLHATSFKKKSTQLKRKMWWKNTKLCCILVCIVVLLLGGGIVIACWKLGVFDMLTKNDSSGSTTGGTTGAGSSSTGTTHSTTAALDFLVFKIH